MSKTTKGIAALPLGAMNEKYVSRTVRKISNGYVISESNDGSYSEKFSPSPDMESAKPKNTGPNEHKGSLAEAASYLKGK